MTANNFPATIVAHSMGGLMSLASMLAQRVLMMQKFLQSQTAQWKKTYIKSYVPVDAPWGGAVNALMGIVSGYNFGPTAAALSCRPPYS